VTPPALQVVGVGLFGDLLGGNADEILLNEPVKVLAFALVFFVLECGFGLDGGICQMLEVAQFEAARTVVVILQR